MATNDILDRWATRFPASLVPQIIDLVLESWKTFNTHPERLEVPITRKFCVHLRNNKNRSEHLFRIDWESHELDDEAKEVGRIDLKFSHGLDEKVYFSIECKRLRVNLPSGFKSLAGDYVEEGMYRYFNGQYAQGLDKGGMLGYVMDGNVDKAIQDVRGAIAIEKRRGRLYMDVDETIHCSTSVSSPWVQETLHKYGPESQFILYHVFLPCKDGRVG